MSDKLSLMTNWGKERKLIAHQLVLFGVLLSLTGWRLLTDKWNLGMDVYKWWMGAVVGFLFVFTDRLVWAFWQKPDETLAVKMKELFSGGKLLEGLILSLEERREQKKMMIRSILFLVIWIVLTILVLTSTVRSFPRGFMLGMGLHLGFDLISDYLGKGRDVKWWMWQVKGEWGDREINWIVWGYMFFLVVLGLSL